MDCASEAQAAATLHHAWCQQLYREYDNVLYQYRLPLRPVSLRVESMVARWGFWDPAVRTITLSAELISQHPWDVVVEVLKHEVAHQLVSEHFGVLEQHGPHFMRACGLVGVASWARSASGELPQHIVSWRDRAVSPEQERLLKKVEKLLSLATSSNEHEALSAMQRVREIYARHNLERLDRGDAAPLVYWVIDRQRKRIDRVESAIVAILVEHFFVRAIFGHRFDAQALSEYRIIEILGSRENVLMAEYVYNFLSRQLQGLWDAYRQRTRCGGGMKQSYMLGVLAGFDTTLRHKSPATVAPTAPANALVARVGAEVDRFVKERHPRLATRAWGRARADATSYRAGHADGERIVLHKAVHGHHGARGRLLGNGTTK